MLLRIVLAALLLSFTLTRPATARAPTAVSAPTSPQQESDRLRLNVETFMQTQDKRIGDLQFYGNMNNGLIALLAIVVTALVVYMAFNFARSAKEEARAAVRDWLEEKAAGELKEKLREFDGKLDKMAADRLERLEAKHSERTAPLFAELQELRESLGTFQVSRMTAGPPGSVSDIVKDPEKLRAAAAAAAAKEPAARGFNDWYLMAWAAMDEEEFAAAEHRFAKAQAVGTPDKLLTLKATFNRASAAMGLGQWDEAISLSDTVLDYWRKNRIADGDLLACYSYLRQGMALGQQKRDQDALKVYDAALAEPWDQSNAELAEVRARIALKRGIALHLLGTEDEAERHYDAFIRAYDATTDNVLQGELATAMYNKLLLRRKAKDSAEENRLLNEIDRRFATSQDPELATIIAAVKSAIAARKSKAKQVEPADV